MKPGRRNPFIKSLLFIVLFSIVASLSSCSKTEDTPMNATDAPTVSDQEDNNGKNSDIVVKFITTGYNDVFDKLGAKFSKQYPGIKVETLEVEGTKYDQVKAQKLLAGEVDVVVNINVIPMKMDWAKEAKKSHFQQEIEIGCYTDLTDMPFINSWNRSALMESSSLNGRVYAVPLAMAALNTVFYNKKIFKDNELTVPETWDEFKHTCEILRTNKIDPLIIGGKDGWPLFMASNAFVAANESDLPAFAKQLWTGERKYNDAKSLKIWETGYDFLTCLSDDYAKISYDEVPEKFAAGDAAMLFDASWRANYLMKLNPSFELGCFTLPGQTKGTDPVQVTVKYDILVSVNDKSPNKEAALKWVEFLSEKQNYKQFVEGAQVIPTINVDVDNAFIASLKPYLKKPTTAWEHVMPAHSNVKLARFSSYVQHTISGGIYATPEGIANAAQREWEKLLGIETE